MKKIFILLIITCSLKSSGQVQKFDIASFSPPKGWMNQSQHGVSIFMHMDSAKGTYCMIAIYRSMASSGNAEQDFSDEWKDIAINNYHAATFPRTETQTSPDGWVGIAGASTIVQDSISSYIVLTVISGFGRKMSVLSNYNDQSYLLQVDSFLASMQFDSIQVAESDSCGGGQLSATGDFPKGMECPPIEQLCRLPGLFSLHIFIKPWQNEYFHYASMYDELIDEEFFYTLPY